MYISSISQGKGILAQGNGRFSDDDTASDSDVGHEFLLHVDMKTARTRDVGSVACSFLVSEGEHWKVSSFAR